MECDGLASDSVDFILTDVDASKNVTVSISAGDNNVLMDRGLAIGNVGIYSGNSERINRILRDVEISEAVISTLMEFSRGRASFRVSFTTLPGCALLTWDSSTSNSGWSPIEYRPSSSPNALDAYLHDLFSLQVTPAIYEEASSSASVDVLALEGCGPASGNVGILRHPLEWEDTTRIAVALETLGLEFPFNIYGSLRYPDYGATKTLDGYNLQSLNIFLFEQYEVGKLERVAVVIDPSEGCGAGEVSVTIESNGTLRRLSVIPRFYFSVCSTNNRDPWSQTECPFWSDVVSEHPAFAGTYTYLAEWNDGVKTKGNFAITEAQMQASWSGAFDEAIIRINR